MKQELTHSWPEGPDDLLKEDSQLFKLTQYFQGFSGDEWVNNIATDITLKKISKKIPKDQCPHLFLDYYFYKNYFFFRWF